MGFIELTRGITVDDSDWVAAHNHITFILQTGSDEVDSITDLGGFCRIFHKVGAGGPLPNGHTVGAKLVLLSLPEYDSVIGTITNVDIWFFDTDIPFVATNFSGSYTLSTTVVKIKATIIFKRNIVRQFDAFYFQDPKGVVRANIAPFAIDELELNQVEDFSEVSQIDPGKDVSFSVIFVVQVQRVSGDFINEGTLAAQDVNAIKGARQLRETNGENYRESVLDETGTALFLSDFDIPSAWVGFPFSLSFIFAKQVGEIFDDFTMRHIEQFDVNGQLIGTNILPTNSNHQSYVSLLTFQDEPIQATTDYVEIYLEDTDVALPTSGYWDIFTKPSYGVGGYVAGNT